MQNKQMKMFTKQIDKLKYWGSLVVTMLFLLGVVLAPQITQAQVTCATANVMTGTGTGSNTGLCIPFFSSVSGASLAADNSLATGATMNSSGIGCGAQVTISNSPVTYPAGTTVLAVAESGGGTLLGNLLGGLLNDVTITLTLNGSPVQTIDNSSNLIQLDLLGLGSNQLSVGAVATSPFNGAIFKYQSLLSVLSGWKFNGIAVQNGCFNFQNCGTLVSSQTTFNLNGTSQTGTITIPITTNYIGGTKVSVSGGGFTSSTANYTLTSGQTSLTIPVTYDGTTTPIGNHTVTVTQYDYQSGTALTNGTCTYLVKVSGAFDFDCANTAPTVSPTTYVQSGTSSTGTITMPIANAIAGQSVTLTVTSSPAGFTGTVTQTLTAGQTSIAVPITYNGTAATGSYTLNVASTKGGNSPCTVTATVVSNITLTNAGPIGKTSGGVGTTTIGNASTDITPTGGVAPYNYTAVDCVTGTTTSSNSTTSTQTTAHGSVTVNKTTGAYTYTPNGTFGVAGDQFCIKVCDSATPANCETVTYNVTQAVSTYGFACPTGALTIQSGTFTANGTTGQTGVITIPLTGATAGSATFTVSGGGFTSSPNPYTTTLTTNQASVNIPVTYDGSGVAGAHAVTVASPAANTSSTCNTGTIAVGQEFGFANPTPASQTTPVGTPLNGNAATTLAPAGGTTPYTYTLVNCTSGATVTTSTAGNTVTVNSSTGAYTYTPASGYSGNDTFCIKVCDSTTPTANCSTATFPITVSVPTAPTISSSPSPIVTGQPATFTATGCNSPGTIQWFANGVAISGATSSTYTANPVAANTTYTATCTVSGTSSQPSNGISSGAQTPAPTITSSPNPPVAGQPATFTASNCAGTIQWYANGVAISGATSSTYTASPAAANTTYTAVCTVNGNASQPSTGVATQAQTPAPTVTTSPSPLVAGQSGTLTASNCAGTIQWYANGVAISGATSATYTANPVVAGTTYTAVCTVNGNASQPSTGVSGSGSVDLATAANSSAGTVFTVNQTGTRTYTISVRNIGTSPSTAGTINIVSFASGYNFTGLGTQSIPSLAPGATQTYTVTASATTPGAAGTITAVIPTGSGGDTVISNNSQVIGLSTTNP